MIFKIKSKNKICVLSLLLFFIFSMHNFCFCTTNDTYTNKLNIVLFGEKIDPNIETLQYVNKNIGDKGIYQIRKALLKLPKVKHVILDNCNISNETMDDLRHDFPNLDVAWRIDVAKRSFLTNTDTLRIVYHLDDSNCDVLKYFPNVKYMDLGHNVKLTKTDYVKYMPHLEIVILSGSAIKNVDAFANHNKLYFMELAYCGMLTDISGLYSCKNLKHLNISFTGVKGVLPLIEFDKAGIQFEQLSYIGSNLTKKEQENLIKNHPNTIYTFDAKHPYGKGWRYIDEGVHFNEIYKKVREVFKYDEVDKRIRDEKAKMNK